MANWDKIESKGKVTDRRGMRSAGGVTITSIVLLMGVTYLMGGNPLDVLQQVDIAELQISDQQQIGTTVFDGEDDYEQFVAAVLGSANDYWQAQFVSQQLTYQSPEIVLFRGRTNSGCGGAASAVGPHYCPADQTIYLDETFFADLTNKLGARGGDVAEAYVIAHEVGHHVQLLLGELGGRRSNEQSIKVELRADCYAGLWAHSLRDADVFGLDEILEAMDAASAVGDDSIQKRTQGEIQPESWTHGSSVQRVQAFTTGYTDGVFATCRAI